MTATGQVREVVQAPPAVPPRPRAPRLLSAAAATGLLAVVCGLLLPFAPVVVSTPTVTWPRSPARIESTLLTPTAYRPLGLDVRFTCDAVRLAAGTGDGTVLTTALPGSGQAGTAALVVTAVDQRLRVVARGQVVLDEAVPAGSCAYRIEGRDSGLPRDVRGPPVPVGGLSPAVPVERVPPAPDEVAGPASATLAVSREGADVGRWSGEQLPDVDMLASALSDTPVTEVPPGALTVSLRVDDESTTAPTALKVALTVLLGLALLATAVLLVLVDRRTARPPPQRLLRWPRPSAAMAVDAVVVAVLVVWTVVAPATDDDGYFATQARNAGFSGKVGDYFQFRDRSFTPFTWPYRALAEWQELVGTAPVLQRLPAAVCGLLTWLLVRRLVSSAGTGEGLAGVRPGVVRVSAAVAFLAWWLPYDLGVRPEAVVALCAAGAAAALLVAAEQQRLASAWLAVAVAGVGAAAHAGGVVLLGVVLAGLPLLMGLAGGSGSPVDRRLAALRAVAVGSGAAAGLLLAFADGALRDFLRGQAAVAAVLGQDGWADEITRYAFLLDPIPMGSLAKRAAVLACLAALVWFAVLAVAARARRVPLPPPLVLTASGTALGFAALWLTPSKWTHHFGALAGIGAAFLGLLLVAAVPLVRAVLDGGRVPRAVGLALVGSVAVVAALTWHGPHSWPYAWMEGVAAPHVRPSLVGATADHPLAWAALVGVVALVLARTVGPRWSAGPAVLRAVPIVAAASMGAAVAFPVAAIAVAAVRGEPAGSLWAQGLADPLGRGCGAAGVVRVLDPATATPLPAVSPPGPQEGFAPGAGFYPGDRPPPGAVWGSLGGPTTGSATTAWYALPAQLLEGAGVTVLAAGDLGPATTLTAVYGRRAGDGFDTAGRAVLGDGAVASHWRTLSLAPPPGADVVRIEAVDSSAGEHGWLAFTAPAAQRAVPLQELLPADAPVALGWQLAFAYPCQRPPAVVHGVTEPPAFAVVRAGEPDAPPLDGLGDIAWQADRGGVFAQVPRTQSVLALATVPPVDPYVQVFAFTSPFPEPLDRSAYTLVPGGRTVGGADTGVAG